MKKCIECGALYSDRAAACPKCVSRSAPDAAAAAPVIQARNTAVNYPPWARMASWPLLIVMAFLTLGLGCNAIVTTAAFGSKDSNTPIVIVEAITLLLAWAGYKATKKLHGVVQDLRRNKGEAYPAGEGGAPVLFLLLNAAFALIAFLWLFNSLLYLMSNNL